MIISTFFIGSYTQMLTPEINGFGDGISTIQLNNITGELSVLHTMKTINPSYLVISEDGKFLYCNTEVGLDKMPKVQAYQINDDFSLEFLNEQLISGGYPCHIEKLDNNIFVACYETGNILQFPLDSIGKLLKCTNNYQHTGVSINKERQESTHAHQVAIHPNKKEVYVCDLGIDSIKAYHFNGTKLIAEPNYDTKVSMGGGPRHMVFNKNGTLAYVLNELSGEVSVLKFIENEFQQISTYSSIPPNFKGIPSASAIRIHPNQTFLYTANRTLDAITVFKINNEKLEVVEYKYTEGNELREFNISPNGKWLIACHQNSHDTVVYKVQNDGKLIEKNRTKAIKTPVCVVF
ncbi:lactonase family protein [Aureibaculum luteum]|uniref:lactonase family protein n=1 Tax=Aureibaculum luteum TaxID=1548456 RepID=UPI000E51D954|nr:lactonase family protein [Aureibaculum luteum]